MATAPLTDRTTLGEIEVAGLCLTAGVSTQGLTPAEAALLESVAAPGSSVKLINAIRAGEDPIGSLFCAVRSAEHRRPMGQFYTDEAIVQAMVSWVLAKGPERVVDCGAGSGRFTTALLRAGFTGEIIAVDLDPLACLMTRANATALKAKNVTVECMDFLDLRLPKINGLTAFIGNPPYVRHHNLPAASKVKAKVLAGELSTKVSGLAGLHALFVLVAATQSRDGDLGCFITSAEWMDTAYGSVLRGLFSDGYGLERLDVIDPISVAFDDAMASAVIVSWMKGYGGKAKARFVSHRRDLKALKGGKTLGHDALQAEVRWSNLTRASAAAKGGYIPLGDVVRVHRGLATGSNAFFAMTRDQAIERGLLEWTSPCLTKAIHVAGDEISAKDVTHVVLDLPAELPDDDVLTAYIAAGEAAGIHEKYLCAHRRPWWRIGGKSSSDIVATYMGRQPPRFALNTAGARTLNTIHGLYFRDPETPIETRDALVQWLNKNSASFIGRTYHGGLMKFEPSEMAAMMIPPRW